MSLLSGMNNMFEDTAVMEAANDELLFDEMLAMEADDLIDELVDGDIDDEDVDDLDDDIDDDLDAEECCEAAALTGSSFLSSLVRNVNDPITTRPGSIGQQSSSASFAENFSDEAEDDIDPITTRPGSIGQQSSSASFAENFSDTALNSETRHHRLSGSIGQKTSSPKDPSMEGSFLSNLVGNDSYISTAGMESTSLYQNANILSIDPLDTKVLENYLHQGRYNEALEYLSEYNDSVDNYRFLYNEDPLSTEYTAANNLSISVESLIMYTQAQRMLHEASLKGEDPYLAQMEVIDKMTNRANQMRQEGQLSSATEAAISNILGYLEMTSAMEEDLSDPEYTKDGSIGQRDSKAHYSGNFFDGILNSSDPVKTRDGSEGQRNSAATFDRNFSGGEDDDFDPIHTDDGSVGQKDSTAKDPAAEALSALDELEELTRSMDEEYN